MDVCYLLVDVQRMTISPYFGVKQGDYFIPFLSKDPVYNEIIATMLPTARLSGNTLEKMYQ